MDIATSTTAAKKINEVKKSDQEKNGGNKSGLIALLITLLLSLGAIVYLFYDNNLVKEQNRAQLARIDSLITVKNNLLKDIDSKKEEIKQFQGKNAELDGLLATANQDLEAKEIKIKKLYVDHSNLERLKKEIKELQDLKEGYLTRIKELEDQLAAMKTENDQLKTSNQELTQKLNSLQEENSNLGKKVELASVMKTSNIIVIGEKQGKGGKYVPSSLKKATRLLVTFDLVENKVAQAGQKDIYIKITNPKGKIIEDSESGTFTNPENNVATPYTTLYKVNYNNSEQKVAVPVEIKKEEKFPGSYDLEFFCDKILIGAKKITVK